MTTYLFFQFYNAFTFLMLSRLKKLIFVCRYWTSTTSGISMVVDDAPVGEAIGRVVLRDLDISETLAVLQDQIEVLTLGIQV